MDTVFNHDKKSIAEARARILQNREAKIIPIGSRNYLDDLEGDSSFCDDDVDCIGD